MATLQETIEKLVGPISRYHEKDNTATSRLGKAGEATVDGANTTKDSIALGSQIISSPRIKELLESLDSVKGDTTKLSDAIIAKWMDPKGNNKSDSFIKNLEADLGKDKNVTAQLLEAIKADPNKVAQNISNYQPGNLASVIPAVPVKEPKNDSPSEKPPAATAKEVKAQPVKAPAASDKVSPAAAVASMGLGAGEEVVTSRTQGNPSTQHRQMSDEIAQGIFESLADKSDQEIINALDKDLVKGIARGMSKEAVSKYDVSASTAEGFAIKIAGSNDPSKKGEDGYDPQLAENIAENWKRNPQFVRQLAQSARDKTPLSKEMKDMARGTITSVMENPEKLAEDAYVKDLSKQMKMGESGGFGSMLKNLFGEGFGGKISAFFGAIFDQIKNFFAGFTGSKSVVSVNSGGKGSTMLPTVLFNLDAMEENRNWALAEANNSVHDMTALADKGADGKFLHNGAPVLGKDGKQTMKDGKPVFEQIPNGQITLKTADGKDAKLIPSVGSLAAKQMGNGNIQFYAATEIASNGATSKMEKFEVTPAEFDKYKQLADAKGKERGGSIQTLTLETFTEAEAIKSGKVPSVQMVSVHPTTGAASPITTVELTGAQNIQQPGLQKSGVETFPVRSANDPDYRLQG